jgi:Ni/Co efflux regulator RcnB
LKRIISACLAASLVAAPVAEAATKCATAKERTAMHVRVMQTELMVAALSCRAVPGRDFTGQYNAFVQRHGEKLVTHGRILTSYFQTRYGEGYRKKLDEFITALANDASRRSMNSTTFCDESVQLFQEVGTVERNGLETWSERRGAAHPVPVEACGAGDREAKSAVR